MHQWRTLLDQHITTPLLPQISLLKSFLVKFNETGKQAFIIKKALLQLKELRLLFTHRLLIYTRKSSNHSKFTNYASTCKYTLNHTQN